MNQFGPKKKSELLINCVAIVILFLFFILCLSGSARDKRPAVCQVCGRTFSSAANLESIQQTGTCETCQRFQWTR